MRGALAVLALLLLAPACGGPAESRAVVLRDPHYSVELVTRGAGTGEGALRLRVETRGGWHVADEAPASLGVEPAAGLEFEPVSLEERTTGSLEFAVAYRAGPDAPSEAAARLKFGICEEQDAGCILVKRDLQLPLAP